MLKAGSLCGAQIAPTAATGIGLVRAAAQAFAGWGADYRMGLVELAAMLVLTLAAAAAIHVFVEQPGRRWLRARLAPQRADPVEAQRSVHSDQGEPF